MPVSRGVFDVETAVRKLSSRFRRPTQVSRPEWPVIPATQSLFYLFRLFGLAPFEISGDHFITGSYDVIYSVFCIMVQTYAAYTVFNRPDFSIRDAVILDATATSEVIFNYFVGVLNVIIAFWTRKEFIKVLNMVKRFDSRIRDLGYPRKEGATKVWAWSTCICTVCGWIIISRLGMAAFNEYWIDTTAYLLNYLVTSLSIIKFSSVVLLVGQRFRLLNRIAKHCGQKCATSRISAIDMKEIQQLHNSLMNTGESLRSQFSLSLLLWLANLCIHSVSTLYSLLENFFGDWTNLKWVVFICQIWWLMVYMVQLLLLHISCHFTSAEANCMGSIMINWTAVNKGQHYRNECFLHLINRKLNFTAAGCFHVNLRLLRSITAILTTYLVLLLQFTTAKRRPKFDS